jgi:GNAT superfamily N-acetyltransferase
MPSKVNPGDFKLQLLSDYPTIEYTRLQNSHAWKGALLTEDYVTRELVLGKAKITSSEINRLLVFCLTSVNNSTPLASIEFLVRQAWRYDVDDHGEVKRQQVLSGCIGGVYTYPENRGMGLAKIMVDLLIKKCRDENIIDPHGFIFLYSEIGEYYAKNGFKSHPIPLINIAPSIEKFDLKHTVELIKYHNFESYMNLHAAQFDKKMVQDVKTDKKSRVSVIPTSDLVDWFHLRAKYISNKLTAPNDKFDFVKSNYEQIVHHFDETKPEHFGLKLKNSNGEMTGFIIWTQDWKIEDHSSYYTVLKIVIVDGFDYNSTCIELLKAMQNHIIDCNENINKIVLWQSEINQDIVEFLSSNWTCKLGLENSSRSAILLSDEKDHNKLLEGNLVWKGNDKLPWF